MSLGRKKSTKTTTKAITIAAPTPITKVTVNTPTGDQYVSATQGNDQTFQSNLTPQTQATVQSSLKGLQTLAQQLNQPDAIRQNAINQRTQDFYNLQAKGINDNSDKQIAKTRSNLAQRFGGTYNATFGANFLAQMENNRLSQLSQAQQQAALYGEDLARQDQNNQMQRFSLFQNYLADVNNQARGLQSNGSTLLANANQQATDLAVQRANLALRASNDDAILSQQQAQQDRQAALQTSSQIMMALMAI